MRADEGHMAIAWTTMVLFWLAIPATGRGRFVLVGGLVVLSALAIKVQPGTDTGRLNPIETLGEAEDQAQLLFSGSRRAELRDFGRSVLIQAFALDEATLAALEGRTVSVDPWEISVAWAYDLDWSPVPIFQNYQAYTEKLDGLNADTIADPDGPERILRENPSVVTNTPEATRGVDNHYPSWDPPEQALATLCNFEPLTETESWQVLGRVPDRCGEPELIGSVDAAFGEPVDVPAAEPGEVVFARIDGAQVSGFEKLRTLLFRARFRYAVLDGATYRLVPGTAADGLLLDGSPRLVGAAPWADAPRAETIELVGVDGDLRYDFYAMSVISSSGPNRGQGGG